MGFTSTGTEVELEEEEAKHENSTVSSSLQITTIQNDAEQNPSFAIPATPLQFGRYNTCNSSDRLYCMIIYIMILQ